MPTAVVRRPDDQRTVGDFLEAVQTQASALLIGGEAGIGKTTLWLDSLERAHQCGFRVLTARAGQLETALAYTTVGDLLSEVAAPHMASIPDMQLQALNRVLMREDDDGPETNQRMIAAAFKSVVEALAADTPTLIAVDDVQWLDSSSRSVLAYAVHRVKSRVGVLLTERHEHDHATAMSWLRPAATGEAMRLRVSPLSSKELHALIEQKLGRSFPRPTMARIATISGGNPLYALELARAIDADPDGGQQVFPRTLAELVQIRIGRLGATALDVLVAAACVPAPTVDLLADVTETSVDQVVALIEEAEDAGIVVIDGNRLGFTHPVLARGVYLNAAAAQRRYWHRAWSGVLREPESKARHLALAANSSDQATLDALDEAAAVVRARGAPAAAAELLDLAIGLGGDTPMRRFAAAEHHLRSGDAARARVVIEPGIAAMPPGPMRALMKFGYSVIVMHTEGYTQAIDVLTEAIDDASSAPPVLVVVRMMLAFAQINDGVCEPALQQARDALAEAEAMAEPALISQALAVWTFVSFNCGLGYDEVGMKRALELEDQEGDVPIPFQASAIHALMLAWTGRLEQSSAALEALGNRLVQRGGELELLFVSYNSAMVSVWRGRYAEASTFSEETFQRTEEIGGGAMRAIGLAVRGWVSAHAGRAQEARADLTAVLEWAQGRGATSWWYGVAVTGLGRLDVSEGRYAEALDAFAPLLAIADAETATELSRMDCLPDAIEALIVMGRIEAADTLIDRLDRNGRAFDRAWMLAAAGRCRGMRLAATGDVDAALDAVQQAVGELERLPMPLEYARTQLLLGQLHRRRRQKHASATALIEALRTFEQLESPVWAARVRAELARTNVSHAGKVDLTPTEQRVAELAADGLSNRDIAAAANVAIKTVEANLSRVYRKLGVRSRVELGRRMDQLAPRADAPER
jgi:DNA-binding CsgD family transcriptional regulator